jgi:hypothetical protein
MQASACSTWRMYGSSSSIHCVAASLSDCTYMSDGNGVHNIKAWHSMLQRRQAHLQGSISSLEAVAHRCKPLAQQHTQDLRTAQRDPRHQSVAVLQH